jgi:hypothetical protein
VALGLLGTLDLSAVTDRLLQLLRACTDEWPLWDTNQGPIPRFTITVSGAMPESVRGQGGCQLSLYLLHVKEDSAQRNAPVMGRTLTIPFQPLSLNLYYLLTAFSADDYRQEQRAMSIALRCLHANPIVRMVVPIEGTNVQEEFTVQLQAEGPDELGRVWQSFVTPFRLSTVYRASVLFVTPPAAAGTPARPPERIVISADPAQLPFSGQGQVIGTTSTVTYFAPSSTAAQPLTRSYDLSPAVVAPGDRFLLLGAGLDQPTGRRVYLLTPGGQEQEVTAWVDPDPARSTASRRLLQVPQAGAPAAGVYQLRVGSDTSAGDTITYRSGSTPFSLAAKVGPAANPPLLTRAAGVFTLAGVGFVSGSTEVMLGTSALARAPGGTPGPGRFRVTGSTGITFRPPASLEPGLYDVRVRVAGVESPPAWWVMLP